MRPPRQAIMTTGLRYFRPRMRVTHRGTLGAPRSVKSASFGERVPCVVCACGCSGAQRRAAFCLRSMGAVFLRSHTPDRHYYGSPEGTTARLLDNSLLFSV